MNFLPLHSFGSGIIKETTSIFPANPQNSTHFVLTHGNKIKYFINLKRGIRPLRKSIATYNKKLSFLMFFLPWLPWQLLRIIGLGYFARVDIHPFIQQFIPEDNSWNILVGTYDEAQKLVFQCFDDKTSACTYVKVGNKGSDAQMRREIDFLKGNHHYSTFKIPAILGEAQMSDDSPFNILITKEFQGEKAEPVLSEEIYKIAVEIAGNPILTDGALYTFSHGDFAPWNIRKNANSYTVFDWEHCGMRPEGYDAAYYIIMSEISLKHCDFNTAFDIAQQQLKQLAPHIKLNREKIRDGFSKTTKALKF